MEVKIYLLNTKNIYFLVFIEQLLYIGMTVLV